MVRNNLGVDGIIDDGLVCSAKLFSANSGGETVVLWL